VALIAGRKTTLFQRILSELPAAFKAAQDFPEVVFEYSWDNIYERIELNLTRDTEHHTRATITEKWGVMETAVRLELWLRHTSLDYEVKFSSVGPDPYAKAMPILMEILTTFLTTQNIPVVEASGGDTSEARTWQVTPGGGYRSHFGCITIQL